MTTAKQDLETVRRIWANVPETRPAQGDAARAIKALRRAAIRAHRWHELSCNGIMRRGQATWTDEDQAQADAVDAALLRAWAKHGPSIFADAAEIGAEVIGDPRAGCALAVGDTRQLGSGSARMFF